MKYILLSVAFIVTISGTYSLTALEEFTNGNRALTQSIFEQLLDTESGNFLVSSFSAEIILALTREGAKGTTQTELTNGLHLPASTAVTREAVEHIMKNFNVDNVYKLLTANKIYIAKNYTLKDAFLEVAKNIYKAGVENVNFADNINTANLINQWVEQQTNNKIQNLINPQLLNELTRVVLVNTLYFFGNWSRQFRDSNTRKDLFYTTPTTSNNVDMMHQTGFFNYFENDCLQYLELPYYAPDNNISMVIVLPKKNKKIQKDNVNKVFLKPSFSLENVQVSLPKFTIESTINFVPILQKLGIKAIFTGDADLSGIAGKKGDLVVSAVVQKTFINVTESGTEAAAATAVGIGTTFVPPPPNYFFNANKPFEFYIQINNIILFAGRVSNPSIN